MSDKKKTEERFAAIPERALRDGRFDAIHYRALGIIALHDRGSKDGCWAKQRKLAEEIDQKQSNFSAAVSELMEWAYVKAKKYAKDARRKVYTVIYHGEHSEIVMPEHNELVMLGGNENPYNSDAQPIPFPGQNTVHEASEQTPLTDPYIKGAAGTLNAIAKEEGQAGRRFVWVEGLQILQSLSLAEPIARKMVGRWIKDCGGDQDRVMAAIESAAAAGTRDPVPYVTAALRAVPAEAAPLGVRRRPDGKWDIPHGTEEYEAFRAKYARENSPKVYSFPDKPGHVAVCDDRWPARKAS
jgi:hypothetical protein